MMAESAEGEVRYLLSDGLGSIRQAVDENAEVVSSDEFDPYGNPLTFHASRFTPYGYTGEWWEQDVGLLHLRARWYLAEDGVFVSRDPVEREPPYLYARGNPINLTDLRGTFPEALLRDSYGDRWIELWKQSDKWWWERLLEAEHGDILISWDKKRVAQFVLDDPLARAYQNILSIQLPWTECDTPLKSPIKLEGFTESGRYYSDTSPSFAESWRDDTGSFYYTGLHPNDATWGQFVYYSGSLNLRSYMSNQYPIFWLYYSVLQTRPSHLAQHIATSLDAYAVGQNLGFTILIDLFAIGTIGTGPEGLAAATAVDVGVSTVSSAVDLIPGTASLAATVLSDLLGGYTIVANGRVRVGEATIHTVVTLGESFVPETHVQLYANVKQLLYDFGIDHYIDIEDDYDIKALEID